MSIEGMWGYLSGTNDEPNELHSGGILILETGKIFGGDSMMAYKGHYEADGERVTGDVDVWRWNHAQADEVENVFGMRGHQINHKVRLNGQRVGDLIVGSIETDALPGIQLRFQMLKFSELP